MTALPSVRRLCGTQLFSYKKATDTHITGGARVPACPRSTPSRPRAVDAGGRGRGGESERRTGEAPHAVAELEILGQSQTQRDEKATRIMV